jgi:hypothetical protein
VGYTPPTDSGTLIFRHTPDLDDIRDRHEPGSRLGLALGYLRGSSLLWGTGDASLSRIAFRRLHLAKLGTSAEDHLTLLSALLPAS